MRLSEQTKQQHLETLASLTDDQRAALDRQVQREREAAIASVRHRLALGVTVPIVMGGVGVWLWFGYVKAIELGIWAQIVRWLALVGTRGVLFALITTMAAYAAYSGAVLLMGDGRHG